MAQLRAVDFAKVGLVDCSDALASGASPPATVSYRWNSLSVNNLNSPEQVYAYGPFDSNKESWKRKLEHH
jgi:hypothetical protein